MDGAEKYNQEHERMEKELEARARRVLRGQKEELFGRCNAVMSVEEILKFIEEVGVKGLYAELLRREQAQQKK